MTTDQRNGRGAATLPDAPRAETGDVADETATGAATAGSKPDRATKASGGSRPSLGLRPAPIAATDPLSTAGRKVMWIHLERLLSRESGARDAERPDELRRYRVATRRLRAALRMFASAYPAKEVRPLRQALSDLAKTVGAVRDLDLRIADLNRWAIERGPDSATAVGPMLAAWARDRERAVAALERRLDSKRHRTFLRNLAAFVEATPRRERRGPSPAPYTLQDRVASRIWLAYEDVRAFAPALDGASLDTLHRLRIAAKRLRDNLEFLGDVLGPDRALLIERLVALQDHLGTLNDATVAEVAVRSFLSDRHADLSDEERGVIEAYLGARKREVADLQQSVGRPWQQVGGISFARRLGNLVVVRAAAP